VRSSVPETFPNGAYSLVLECDAPNGDVVSTGGGLQVTDAGQRFGRVRVTASDPLDDGWVVGVVVSGLRPNEPELGLAVWAVCVRLQPPAEREAAN
jgi:hypothetical protein